MGPSINDVGNFSGFWPSPCQQFFSAICWQFWLIFDPCPLPPTNHRRRLRTAPSIFWKNIFMQLQSVPIPTPTRYYSHFDTVSTWLWSDFLQKKICREISLTRLSGGKKEIQLWFFSYYYTHSSYHYMNSAIVAQKSDVVTVDKC